MNPAPAPSATSVLKNESAPSPALIPALALALRGRAAFGFEFLRIIVSRLRSHILWQRQAATQAAAIDDPIEREEAELIECLRNDPVAKRRRILAAWHETHRRTQTLAAHLDPNCPDQLMRE